jgi:hypothetical protein
MGSNIGHLDGKVWWLVICSFLLLFSSRMSFRTVFFFTYLRFLARGKASHLLSSIVRVVQILICFTQSVAAALRKACWSLCKTTRAVQNMVIPWKKKKGNAP